MGVAVNAVSGILISEQMGSVPSTLGSVGYELNDRDAHLPQQMVTELSVLASSTAVQDV